MGINTFYPVYSYEIDGEQLTWQSNYPSISPMKIGTQVSMYYNHQYRHPVEAVSAVGEVAMAMVFSAALICVQCL